MSETTLGLVVRVLHYKAPYYAGDPLIAETARTLEVAFNVTVPSRKQLFNYTFSFLRYISLLDTHNTPRKTAVRESLGLDPDPYLTVLAKLKREEVVLLQELLTVVDEGWVRVEHLKARIREATGEILEVGLGAAGLARRLRERRLIKVRGGEGRGARNTRLALRNETVRRFLNTPLVLLRQVHHALCIWRSS